MPDLKRGFTFASFQESGNPPDVMLLFTIMVRLGVITLAEILRTFGPILSIPVDLLVFNRERNFLTKVSFVGDIMNSVSMGIFDLTYSVRSSKYDGTIGYFRFEATFTKYELKTSVKSFSSVITRSPTFMFKFVSSLPPLRLAPCSLKSFHIVLGSVCPSSISD